MDGKPRRPESTAFDCLKRAGLSDEFPFDPKFFGNFGSECFDAKNFCCVVPAWVKVEPEFLSHIEVVLSEFPSHERVDAIREQVGHRALAAAGQNPDAFRLVAPVFDGLVGLWKELFQLCREFTAAARRALGDGRHIVALVTQEGVLFFQAEGFC